MFLQHSLGVYKPLNNSYFLYKFSTVNFCSLQPRILVFKKKIIRSAASQNNSLTRGYIEKWESFHVSDWNVWNIRQLNNVLTTAFVFWKLEHVYTKHNNLLRKHWYPGQLQKETKIPAWSDNGYFEAVKKEKNLIIVRRELLELWNLQFQILPSHFWSSQVPKEPNVSSLLLSEILPTQRKVSPPS